MSFKLRKGTSLTLRRGDSKGIVFMLQDSPFMKQGNGIHVGLGTSSDVEKFIGGIASELDGVVNKYNCPAGTYYDEDAVIPNDTRGDSANKTFTVAFSDTKETCAIVIPAVKITGNVGTIAAFLKTQAFKDKDGTALTISKVDVKQSF